MNDGQLLDSKTETIETWAYVEIMGHSQVAGRVSERKVGIQVMLQIDVPKSEEGFSHTKLYSPSSIFSISPTTEEWCRQYSKAHIDYPVLPYIPQAKNQLPAHELFDKEDLEEGEADFLRSDPEDSLID
jgi:hypothetical protein